MRINKLFSNYGICSRKETNKLIEEKRIKVNGKLCVLGQWIEEDIDLILLDDKPIYKKDKIYIAMDKPVGIICTAQNDVKGNIIDFLGHSEYVFPVGRLDKDSQGLIIMTNDGELANAILECENLHEKEYIVTVDRKFEDEFIAKMSEGVEISADESSGIKRISDTLGVYKNINEYNSEKFNDVVSLKELAEKNIIKKNKIKTRPCKLVKIDHLSFRIILTQGLNRQIRKMCGALGYKVIRLERVRIMNITIDNLEDGKWRYLRKEEIAELKSKAFNSEYCNK